MYLKLCASKQARACSVRWKGKRQVWSGLVGSMSVACIIIFNVHVHVHPSLHGHGQVMSVQSVHVQSCQVKSVWSFGKNTNARLPQLSHRSSPRLLCAHHSSTLHTLTFSSFFPFFFFFPFPVSAVHRVGFGPAAGFLTSHRALPFASSSLGSKTSSNDPRLLITTYDPTTSTSTSTLDLDSRR